MQKHSVSDFETAEPARALEGRSAIVTGSTSGIGLGIARALAEAGADIVLNGFGDRDAIETLRAGLARACRVRVEFSPADLSRPDEVAAMVASTAEAFGRVDILVNNAGVFYVDATDRMALERWDATLAVNLSAAFLTTRAALPGMKARGWGRIINVASALGLVGAPEATAYAASKHGVVGLTRAVALEVAEAGITANAICPGYVLTPLIQLEARAAAEARGVTEAEAKSEFLSQTMPTRRFVDVSEIGALAAFLCTDAARSITGAALPVDGGWTAR